MAVIVASIEASRQSDQPEFSQTFLRRPSNYAQADL
jgi:hypothetical protein